MGQKATRRLQLPIGASRLAAHAFLDALDAAPEQGGLPKEAKETLKDHARNQREGEDVEFADRWATDWAINATCVIVGAQENISGYRRHGEKWPMDFGRGLSPSELHEGRSGGHVPEAWRHELATLNELPLLPSRWIELDDEVDAGIRRVAVDEGGGSTLVRASREDLLEQDHVLARIATDPSREVLEDFLRRAQHLWEGRAQIARRKYHLEPIPSRPNIIRHAQWLAWRQVHRFTPRQIALQYGVEVEAVRKATARLAEDLQLRSYRRRPGRPRKKRDKSA